MLVILLLASMYEGQCMVMMVHYILSFSFTSYVLQDALEFWSSPLFFNAELDNWPGLPSCLRAVIIILLR